MLKIFTLLLIICSCTSLREKDLPEFDEKAVCSSKSLKYLATSTMTTHRKDRSSKQEIHEQMLKVRPEVQKCYQDEIKRTRNPHLKFNLCHISGYDQKGVQEYYQFSSRGTELTASMKYCLEDIRSKVKIINLKNVKILQPFALKSEKSP